MNGAALDGEAAVNVICIKTLSGMPLPSSSSLLSSLNDGPKGCQITKGGDEFSCVFTAQSRDVLENPSRDLLRQLMDIIIIINANPCGA